MNLLDVKDLNVTFMQDGQPVRAVRGVSFHVAKGETVAIVGESGSGKSVSALSCVGLLPDAAQVTWSVAFKGEELIGQQMPSCGRCAATTSASSFRNR
jgi:microcin C transport system ATP-binding protein